MPGGTFKRELQLGKIRSSAFLFGPRMTGKTTLLLSLSSKHYYDLLDPELELRLRQTPRFLWEEIQSLPKGSLIIIDEVQKIPSLLDTVQRGIDQLHHRFILSGSSARKLKRGGANLLGGRALNLGLHPLTVREMGEAFDIRNAIHFGIIIKKTSQSGYPEALPFSLWPLFRRKERLPFIGKGTTQSCACFLSSFVIHIIL